MQHLVKMRIRRVKAIQRSALCRRVFNVCCNQNVYSCEVSTLGLVLTWHQRAQNVWQLKIISVHKAQALQGKPQGNQHGLTPCGAGLQMTMGNKD